MDLNKFVGKYGTEGTSMILRSIAKRLEEAGGDVDVALVNEMADDLYKALEDHLFWSGKIKVKNTLTFL